MIGVSGELSPGQSPANWPSGGICDTHLGAFRGESAGRFHASLFKAAFFKDLELGRILYRGSTASTKQ
jgi:hypothetical protein